MGSSFKFVRFYLNIFSFLNFFAKLYFSRLIVINFIYFFAIQHTIFMILFQPPNLLLLNCLLELQMQENLLSSIELLHWLR